MTKPRALPAAYPLDPALDFLQRLWRTNHALERLSGDMKKRLGVTAQQRLLLRCVGRYPGLTAGQLARVLHVDPGTLSAALRRLERDGMLVRGRDPRDRRRAAIGLTAKGRALSRPVPGTVEHGVDRLLSTATPSELSAFASVLDALTVQLEHELR